MHADPDDLGRGLSKYFRVCCNVFGGINLLWHVYMFMGVTTQAARSAFLALFTMS